MGVGIYTKAALKRHGLLRRVPARDEVLGAVEAAVRAKVTDDLAVRMLRCERNEHMLGVCLDLTAEMLEFTWDPKGFIVASAKTSTTGPGYHAHVVDIVKHVGAALGVEWDWKGDPNEGVADETGFATTGDFAALQKEMQKFLGKLAEIVVTHAGEQEGLTDIAINFPVGVPMIVDQGFVVTSMGPFSREWVERNATAPSEQAAKEFYPWWERERGAAYWRNMGMSLLWTTVRWHAPADGAERAECQLALDCFDRAAKLDPSAPLPVREIEELRAIVGEPFEGFATAPSPDRIGYLRHLVRHHFSGSWAAMLPGYYYQSVSDDGTSVQLFFGDRCVYLSLMTVQKRGGGPESAWEMVRPLIEKREGGVPITHRTDAIAGFAEIEPPTEESEGLWTLRGMMAVPGNVAVVTITYADEADRAWAEEVYRSVSHPPVEGGE